MKYKLYKVGGCVRDSLLGIESKDIDFSFEFTSEFIKENSDMSMSWFYMEMYDILEKEGYENEVTIYQSKIADELNRIDDYDAVISTTIVPDSIKDKVINGLGLLTGINADQILNDVKERLGL